MLRNGNKYLLMLVSIIMLTACISQSRTSFIPPQDRESLLAEQPWPHNGFVAISWHNRIQQNRALLSQGDHCPGFIR